MIYRARKSLWHYVLRFFIGGIVLVISVPSLIGLLFSDVSEKGAVSAFVGGWVVVGLALIAWPFIVVRNTELAVTNRRVISKYDVFSTSSLEIRFEKIETVRVRQGLLGRILGYGDIDIRGTGSTFDPITSIANPQMFKSNLDQAMHPET